MCHLGNQEYMPVNKTWGIMPLSSMYPSVSSLHLLLFISSDILTVFVSSLGLSRGHPWRVKLFGKNLHDHQVVWEIVFKVSYLGYPQLVLRRSWTNKGCPVVTTHEFVTVSPLPSTCLFCILVAHLLARLFLCRNGR